MTNEERDERFYRDSRMLAWPKLEDWQLALLEPLGKRRILRRGEFIFEAGQRDLGMAVILSGEAEVFESLDGVERVLATPGARNFVGDVAILNGSCIIASARGKAEESEILEIPAAELRRALAELPGVSETIIQAFMIRRARRLRDKVPAGPIVLTTRVSRDGHHIHDFLDKNQIPHRFIEFESEEGAALCQRLNFASHDLPAFVAANGWPLRRPSLREVAHVAGLLRPLGRDGEDEVLCDLAIVGAGPAGLAAAVCGASEGLKTVVLESFAPGGQARASSLIENFFSYPTGISGGDLTSRAQLQAYRFGAIFSTPMQALSLTFRDGEYGAELQVEGSMACLRAKCVIIATGADYRRIDAEGRENFEGSGVYYAATALEGQLCRGSTVVVAGAGNSAGQAAMFLSDCAEKVVLVVRGDHLGKSMSSYLAHRVEAKQNVEILYNSEIRKMSGGKRLESVEIEDAQSRERRVVQTTAVFSMIGAEPCTRWLPAELERCPRGFIKTGPSVANAPAWKAAGRSPSALETSRPGIFAAGDVRAGSVKRCAAAVGEGGTAVEGVHQCLGTYS